MAELPPIGALWIGGSLTWLEQLCLKSFVAHGHETILFTYGEVVGIPEGVAVRDGREVLDTKEFITHARTESVALFSDLFRFHMIKAIPGIIYVDTDIFCHRPIDFEAPFVFGYEAYLSPEQSQVNGAVLRLPAGSETLAAMIEFMGDAYPLPDWLPAKHLGAVRQRAASGDPMHVSEMPWGIWGPLGLTAFLRRTGEIIHARSTDVFYPVHFRDRAVFFQRPMKTISQLTAATRTIHLWAPIKKLASRQFDGLCRKGSFLHGLLDQYEINPADAPVPVMRKRAVVQ